MIPINDNDGKELRHVNEQAENKYINYRRKTIQWIGEMKKSFDTCKLQNADCPGRITLDKFEKDVA